MGTAKTEDIIPEVSPAVAEAIRRAWFELSLCGWVLSEGIKIITVNKRFYETFGYSPLEIPNLNFMDLLHPDDRDVVAENLKIEYEGPFNVRAYKKSGDEMVLEVRAKVICSEDRLLANISFVDTTHNIRVIEKLKTDIEYHKGRKEIEGAQDTVISGLKSKL